MDGAVEDVAIAGYMICSVTYGKRLESLWLSGQSCESPTQLFLLDVCSYDNNLLLMWGCEAQTLLVCLER